jgi:hypothetical protein
MPEEQPLQKLALLKLVCEAEFVLLVKLQQVEEFG